jgi:chromate transporter
MGVSDVVEPQPPLDAGRGSVLEVLAVALRLGLTSFGGPIAHLGYFRREYVERRRWVDESTYADLVALSQFLPGPASSQVGIAVGTRRAGMLGGLAAWVGFTLPSAIALALLGILAASTDLSGAGWVHGLKLAAVAVVAQAVLSMARTLTPDWPRRILAVIAAAIALAIPDPFVQVAIIAGGALAGWLLLAPPPARALQADSSPIRRSVGVLLLAVFALLLVVLPLAARTTGDHGLALFESQFRAGALVFGGGHVVLPLLQSTVVDPGWVTQSQFLAGYGAAQAVPGPLFAFAAYLGAVQSIPPAGWLGATIALVGIFLPSFLLVWGAMPFWDSLRTAERFRRALAGTNAAVVGILAAALYSPVWTSAVTRPVDILIAGAGFALLVTGRAPPIAVVALCAVAGQLVGA